MTSTFGVCPEDSTELSPEKTSLENFKKAIDEKEIKCRKDDTFLLGFLRSANFDVEKSLQLLKNYYCIRIGHPDLYKNLTPSKLEHVLSLKSIWFLPKPDQDGRYVTIFHIANWDVSVANALDYVRTILLFMDYQWNFTDLQEKGAVFIINASGLSYRHFFQITRKLINALVAILFRCTSYQSCFKEIHCANMNVIMRALVHIVIPFLPTEIKNILHFHSDLTSLHKFVHPQYLPAEYEGELQNFDPTEANELIKEKEEFFGMNEEYCNSFDGSGIS